MTYSMPTSWPPLTRPQLAAFICPVTAEDTPEALKAAYQKERDPELRTRLHGLFFII